MRSTTDPLATKSLSEQGYIGYTHYHNLPEKRVLLLTHGESKKTTLKIFSADNLQTPLKEKTIPNSHLLSGIFPDGSFLLCETERQHDETASLIRVCSNTLEFLSIQHQENHLFFRDAGIIDNEHFFVITNKKPGSEHMLCLLSFDTQNKKYVITSETSPFADLENLPDHPQKTLSLGKNRYCCAFTTFNNGTAFKVVVFDIDPKNHAVKVHGLIEPKKCEGRFSSVRILALPNGRLLTHHKSYGQPDDPLQIWDTEKLTCIKDWSWNNTRGQRRITHAPCQIKSFPDSRHLLLSLSVHSSGSGNLCLFNTDTLVIKLINLPKSTHTTADHHVLSNGEVLAFTEHLPHTPLAILHFDLQETIDFRKRMSEYKLSRYCVSQGIFSRSRTSPLEKLPDDVRNIIVTHAFTPEVAASALNKETEKEKSQKERCSIM